MPSFTVLVIATNRYVDFLPASLESICLNLFPDSLGQVLVFTNDEKFEYKPVGNRIKIQKILIPNYGWPDATLRRYEIFSKYWDQVSGDYVIYIDVDAIVVGKPLLGELITKMKAENAGVFVVEHPGYFKRDWKTWVAARRKNGIWETNRKSSAFVPLIHRRKYFAGGVWGGERLQLSHMITKLEKNVAEDLKLGIVALSHDESHLNSWATKNDSLKLGPSWVFAPGYSNLSGITPIIQVIHKPEEYFEARKE